MTKASAVILTFNDTKLTLSCIKSLLRQKNSFFTEIIVVDNASEKVLSSELKKKLDHYNQIKLIRLKNNRGFSAGINRGIKEALNSESQYIFVLNNDTEIDSRALEFMLKASGENDGIGIVSPKIYFEGKDKIIWFGGSKKALPFPKHRGYGKHDFGQYEKKIEIPFASGCAMMFSRDAILNLGLFDERFFFGLEDREISFRFLKNGYKIIYEPKALVYHKVAYSRDKLVQSRVVYLAYLSRLFFIKITKNPILWITWYLFYFFYITLCWPIRFYSQFKNTDLLKKTWLAALQAWFHAWEAERAFPLKWDD